MEKFYFNIEEKDKGKRVDVFLAENMNEISRSYVQKLIDEDMLLVNSKKVKSSYKLNSGDEIIFTLKEAETLQALPEDIDIDIIYQDKDIVVVNKAKGMVVHPAVGNSHKTLVNALMFHVKDLSSINGVVRPGIVHRIDKDTSGILVIAKNDEAHRKLSEQLKKHSMDREYYALVDGIIKKDEGTINKAIGRDKNNRLKMGINEDGKEAITHFKVLKRYKNTTLIKCKLETGRTHQIRVHMASIGYPIVEDPLYQSKKNSEKAKGQMLHAAKLGFIHPRSEEFISFRTPVNEEFKKLLEIKNKEYKALKK